MYDEIEVSLKGVEAPVTTGAGAYTAVRDPMLLLRETRVPAKKEPEKKPALEVVAKPKKPAADLPPLTIENIFWEPETPLVAIDGRVCKEGEKYQEYQVIKIRERNVDILWRNRVYTMQPGSTDIEKEDK
jgi:hypothetical protein